MATGPLAQDQGAIPFFCLLANVVKEMLQGQVLVHGYRGTFESFLRDYILDVEKEPLQGWKLELVACMIQNKLLDGSFEYDSYSPDYSFGYPVDYDAQKATSILSDMLKSL